MSINCNYSVGFMPAKLKAEIGTLFYVGGDRYVLDVDKNRQIGLYIPKELKSTAAQLASYPVVVEGFVEDFVDCSVECFVDGVASPSASKRTRMYLEVTNIYRRGD